MDYNSVGGIKSKNQVHKKKGQEQKKTTYSLDYGYGETQLNAPIHMVTKLILTMRMEIKLGGLMKNWRGERNLVDEGNRIRAIYDHGSQHHYIYDASGERVIKGRAVDSGSLLWRLESW